ncbi:hypothetical protein GCM10017779_67780 [Streptomyces capillispiralis]|nr:hypothetical protein GCM10017779_67780 [Streptomyces capillispiralis]
MDTGEEVRGEAEDLVARAIQEMSSRKTFSFHEVMHLTPAMDPSRVHWILGHMEAYGAIKPQRSLWLALRADPGPHYRVDAQALERYRDNYAAPPPYGTSDKPLPPSPTERPLPARPSITPQEVVRNMTQHDAGQMEKYKANELARSIDWPIMTFPGLLGDGNTSIAHAASRRASTVRSVQRGSGVADSTHSSVHDAQPRAGRAR